LQAFTQALVQAQRVLEELDDRSVLPEELAEARQRVAAGDPSVLEDLLARIQIGPDPGRTAEAAYRLGVLAEAEGALRNAEFYYRRAVQLGPGASAARPALAALAGRFAVASPDAPLSASRPAPASAGGADASGRVFDGEITFPIAGQPRVRAPLRVVGAIRNTTRGMHYWLVMRTGRLAPERSLLQTPKLMTVETERVDGGEPRTMLRFERVIPNPPAGAFTLLLYSVPDEGERVLDARVARGDTDLEPLPPGAVLLDRVALNVASRP
jgi:hypothetical protein